MFCHTYPTMTKLGTLPKEDPKYQSRDTATEFC